MQSYQSGWDSVPHSIVLIQPINSEIIHSKIQTKKFTIMKSIFILMVLASIVILFSVSSCRKDLQVPAIHTASGYNAGTSPFTLNLKADNWINAGDGFYVNTFRNIIPARYYSHSIKVYLLTENREIQINHFISFMGGELWASVTGTDVTLIYHCRGQLLFDYLNIKVLIE